MFSRNELAAELIDYKAEQKLLDHNSKKDTFISSFCDKHRNSDC